VGQRCGIVVRLLLGLLMFDKRALPAELPAASEANATGYVGDTVCARCHDLISESYSRTNMAHASGLALENFIQADFTHKKSGVHYRIYEEGGSVWLSFERPGDPSVQGKRKLLYYIGSGHRGLTYLFSMDGFFFESPVNWYGKSHIWDMTPAYQDAKEMPLNLPVFTSCLRCHVSAMQPPISATENRYAMPLLRYSGITCEQCHGPGAAHANGGPIVNPAKLPPERRDQVCMQCHLEGKIAIERAGRHAYDYRPGDNLSNFIRYYVLEGSSRLGAVSQVEAMAQSACRRKSGDKMSCTSCHDPHYLPSASERDVYYRGKCLACHGAAFGAQHHADQPDCTACHMSALQSTDVAHTQVTDHRIPRRPELSGSLLPDLKQGSTPTLVPFPRTAEPERDVRDLALAWQSLAERGIDAAGPKAESLLRSALKTSPDDPALLSALGYVEQRRGRTERAQELYRRALTFDPDSVDVLNNLGVIEAKAGHSSEAVKVWAEAFQHAPGRSSLGMNIAEAFCEAGQFDAARTTVLRVLEFNPDDGTGRELLKNMNHEPASCGSFQAEHYRK